MKFHTKRLFGAKGMSVETKKYGHIASTPLSPTLPLSNFPTSPSTHSSIIFAVVP